MTKEVLQQALDVLRGCADHPDADDAVAAIEFELAQTVPPATERNFCERCGKRLGDVDNIHTCTPNTEGSK